MSNERVVIAGAGIAELGGCMGTLAASGLDVLQSAVAPELLQPLQDAFVLLRDRHSHPKDHHPRTTVGFEPTKYGYSDLYTSF